ncbi:MAG: hypothetical protein LUG51_06200 [Tannerellaceae bacterium]|nr:hypothetical protein [Tannerellaceae bacterium]
MKRILFLLSLYLLTVAGTVLAQTDSFDVAVRIAVERQMITYPKSTLKDLYKNFFQDKYGPGHIISDTTGAGNYLRRELATMTRSDGELVEPTGWEGNFLRVNLSLVKEKQIPYPVFFDAFTRSVNGIQPPPVPVWKEEWERIEKIIASMDLSLAGYESDKAEIDERLENGEFVGHHSPVFEETYSPHYRIISRDIFEKELLPFLLNKKEER